MKDKIYAYSLFSNYKYIVAFKSKTYTSKPYVAMCGTNNKYKAIWLALKNHLSDKLNWVVIQNFKRI